MRTALIPNVQIAAVAHYDHPRPAWHAFVGPCDEGCGCRRPAVDPWPSAPVVPPRRQLGVTR